MNLTLRHPLAALLLVAWLSTQTSFAEDAEPKLKGLIVAGGCCHDYPRQKLIISEGVSQRISIAWDIVHEGDDKGKKKGQDKKGKGKNDGKAKGAGGKKK